MTQLAAEHRIDPAVAHRRAAIAESRLLRTRLAPPPDLSVSEWADAFRILSREASAEPGRWRTDRAPYLRGMMDAFSDPTLEQVIAMTSAQIGKTECLNNICGYFMDQDPAPILVLQPTQQMGEAWSKDRLAPMLRDSPKLHGKVAPVKSRDSGNTILHKKFPGGHLTISGANSAASLASRPIRIVLCDEIDRYPASAGSEGDPVTLAFKRTATFWNRKLGLWSTPTIKGFSRIEEAWEESDQRRYHVPCPHCNHLQTLRWKGLQWEKNDPATAAYACESCGTLIEEQDKHRMLLGGVWVAEQPGKRIAGFHLNALYSPWARWEELVREFLDAQGNLERLKVWVNTVLGETWEEDGDHVDPGSLLHRLEKYPAEVPDGVGLLTAAVDVQGDRLELAVKGWGASEESWLIAWEQLWGDPGHDDVWKQLEHHLTRTYTHENGKQLKIRACCIDSGGHHTEEVYRFVKPRWRRRVWAIKGMGGWGRAIVGRPTRNNKQRVRLFPVGVDTAKDMIFSRLKITSPGPGYLHLPDWLDEEYIHQLTGEKVVTRYHKGRPVREYKATRDRVEALDLEVYNLAALVGMGPVVLKNLGIWAEKVAEVVEEEEPIPGQKASPRVPKAPRPAGWVNSWR